MEMLGSGTDKGIAGVDRSLGERNGGWWVAQWWLIRDLVRTMTVVCRESASEAVTTSGFFEN